ncbi:hypothetical protein [Cesiribacter andamanensis]|uniref:Uncharacterized protein n=1 Tax=Cesiribacter andamanensis AMV16 TaxID=1279009 RepID=M7NV81_9BACT|nr:hypothetical protein [Cesiribacter andamanensis]EMR02364.1 hypothetical protein ADICEAN_02513 [Cesiribacter andamanensis AMV16]
MKTLEKWLAKAPVQRLVYLLVLLLWLFGSYRGGHLQYLTAPSTFGPPIWVLLLIPTLLLGTQLWFNSQGLWRILCGLLILFSFWLATLSVQDIARPFTSLQPLIWNFGSFGFLLLLVLVLALANWVLLHMKPKR